MLRESRCGFHPGLEDLGCRFLSEQSGAPILSFACVLFAFRLYLWNELVSFSIEVFHGLGDILGHMVPSDILKAAQERVKLYDVLVEIIAESFMYGFFLVVATDHLMITQPLQRFQKRSDKVLQRIELRLGEQVVSFDFYNSGAGVVRQVQNQKLEIDDHLQQGRAHYVARYQVAENPEAFLRQVRQLGESQFGFYALSGLNLLHQFFQLGGEHLSVDFPADFDLRSMVSFFVFC